jgi:hypothetical protein
MSKLSMEVHVVIDGLDECGEGTREACHSLGQLLFASDINISFALLSRDEAGIRDVFDPVCAWDLRIGQGNKAKLWYEPDPRSAKICMLETCERRGNCSQLHT